MHAVRRYNPRVAWTIAAAVLCAGVGACSSREDRSSPDAVVDTAYAMVMSDHPERLVTLVNTDDPRLRLVLDEFGVLLADVHKLSKQVARSMPGEVAKLREKGADGAGVAELIAAAGLARRDDGKQLRNVLRSLMADPYGWILSNRDRITTTMVDEDTAAVLFDGQPAIPIAGLILEPDVRGRWGVMLPTYFPPVARALPQDDEQAEILAAFVQLVDRIVVELTEDVREGRITSLAVLADEAGDRVFVPAAIIFVAYSGARHAEDDGG